MANPVVANNRAGYDQAVTWAQTNLSAGVDPEALVGGLIKQGWPEFDARQVLDEALTAPTGPAAPMQVSAARVRQPAVMNYASPRPANRPGYNSAIKSAHARNMMIGGALFGVGVAVTIGSMAASAKGGTYILAWGPIIFGGYRMVVGFIGWVSS